jgi:uncharacterized membrane protein YadS
VLPLLWHPFGLSALQFGHWVGAGVHDVGQVVATAQVAGSAALGVALVVKLTRVLMLAPVIAVAAMIERHHQAGRSALSADVAHTDRAAARMKWTPILPLFVAGFIAALLVRTLIPLPEQALNAADVLQTGLLAMALFALGTAVNLGILLRTGGRPLAVGLLSWALIAALALGAVHLS